MRKGHITVLGGGAGGVGRSTLAVELARVLVRVQGGALLVDASAWSPTLAQRVGVEPVRACRFDRSLAERVLKAECGASLLMLTDAEVEDAGATLAELRRLARHMPVLVDLGSAPAPGALDLFLGADLPLLVLASEIGPLTACTSWLQATLVRKMEGEGTRVPAALRHPAAPWIEGGLPELARRHGVVDALAAAVDALGIGMVLHHTRDSAERDLGPAIALGWAAMTGARPWVLGAVDHDDRRWFHMRQHELRTPLSSDEGVGVQVQGLIRAVEALEDGSQLRPPAWHRIATALDLIGLREDMEAQAIRAEGRRLWEALRRDSPLTVGLLPASLRTDLIERVESANRELQGWLVEGREAPLTTAELPALAAEGTGAGGADAAAGAGGDTGAIRKPGGAGADSGTGAGSRGREGLADTEGGGAASGPGQAIRERRDAIGISQRELSLRTRIGLRYLDAIERFDVASLPRAVYLRGYLREIARALDLNADALLGTYLDAVAEARREPILRRR